MRLEPAVAFIQPESGTTQTSQNPTSGASSTGDLVSTSAAVIVPGTNVFQERVLIIRGLPVVTDPARTLRRPEIVFRVVVLPAPLAPIRVVMLPSSTPNVMSRIASMCP